MESDQPLSTSTGNSSEWSDSLNTLFASFLGWTLDAFDFFVLIFAIPAIAKDFHTDIPAVAATSAVTLAFRPVGAFFFGLMADRYGRRLPLMLTWCSIPSSKCFRDWRWIT